MWFTCSGEQMLHSTSATLIPLQHAVCGCFDPTEEELSSFNTNSTKPNAFAICPFTIQGRNNLRKIKNNQEKRNQVLV